MSATGSISKPWRTIFFILALTLSSFAKVYSQDISINPDSIPFALPVSYGTSGQPQSVLCADLDGDTDLDVVVAGFLFSKPLSIFKNDGDGMFHVRTDYDVGEHATSVFCADLDGDTDLDLVVGHFGNNLISILRNNGDGTFEPRVDYDVGGYPVSVFCADIDKDGDQDLTAATHKGNGTVSVLKNDRTGVFLDQVDYPVGTAPWSVFCADLNGDQNIDVVVANEFSSDVSVLLNNGDGTFQAAVQYPSGTGPLSVFCSDLDRDSHLDIVVASYSNGGIISVLKNNGDGTFQPKVDYYPGGNVYSVFCADLDGDFFPDLVASNYEKGTVSILKNKADGTFSTAVNYNVNPAYLCRPTSVFCADLDGDRDLDIVVSQYPNLRIGVLKNLTINLSRFYPLDKDSVTNAVNFSWQALWSSSPDDTVRYDLYLSHSMVFNPDSTFAYEGLLDTTFSDTLDLKTWYWKVKAYSHSGMVRYSDPSWNFYVYQNGDCNRNDEVSISDVVYLIDFLLKAGLPLLLFSQEMQIATDT